MRLELSDEEGRELLQALERFCAELIDEIGHTDDHDYRADLARTYDRLDEIRKHMEQLVPGGPSERPAPPL